MVTLCGPGELDNQACRLRLENGMIGHFGDRLKAVKDDSSHSHFQQPMDLGLQHGTPCREIDLGRLPGRTLQRSLLKQETLVCKQGHHSIGPVSRHMYGSNRNQALLPARAQALTGDFCRVDKHKLRL